MNSIGGRTRAEMRAVWCPQAKVFSVVEGAPHVTTCIGDACPLFRVDDRITPEWILAVRRVAEEIGDRSGNGKKASALVTANPEKHGLETAYYCGLGGKP